MKIVYLVGGLVLLAILAESKPRLFGVTVLSIAMVWAWRMGVFSR